MDELVASPAASGKDAASVLIAEGSAAKTVVTVRWFHDNFQFRLAQGAAVSYGDESAGWSDRGRYGWRRTSCWRKYVRALIGSRVPLPLSKQIRPSAEGHEPISAGVNVRCEWSDDVGRFYSAIEGFAKLQKNSIRVKPVAHIAGDVDENVVFADAEKDVYVTGSVRPGVVVRAAGSIAIDGMVESGAQVHSNEDVSVSKGIVGRQSQVVAMGDVATKFVQNGSIVARGDVNVTSHVVNARIRAGGKFIAESDGT